MPKLLDPKIDIEKIEISINTNDIDGAKSITDAWGPTIPVIKINDYVISLGDILSLSVDVKINTIPKFTIEIIDNKYKVRKALKKNKDLSIICDVLSVTNSLGASLACKSLNRTCVGIVTDMPEFLESDDLYIKLVHKVISNCSDYIFLTEAMNQRLNPTKKPYKIIEGISLRKIK